jgi:hypothetical protein
MGMASANVSVLRHGRTRYRMIEIKTLYLSVYHSMQYCILGHVPDAGDCDCGLLRCKAPTYNSFTGA